MAKKYLLYIHDSDPFDTVENKSELVNGLLSKHWNENIPGSDSSRKTIKQILEENNPTYEDNELKYEPID